MALVSGPGQRPGWQMVRKREALPRPPLKSSGGQAPHTPHMKVGHQRSFPPRRRPPSAVAVVDSFYTDFIWFRHRYLGMLLLPLHRTFLCCIGGNGLHGVGGGGGRGHVWCGSDRGYCLLKRLGVWTGFLHYQLPLCKVCMLSFVPEL